MKSWFKKIWLRLKPIVRSPLGLVLLSLLGLIILHSAITLALSATVYEGKTRYNLTVGELQLGSLEFDEAVNKVQSNLDEQTITIHYDDQSRVFQPDELGITLDREALSASLREGRTSSFLIPWFITDEKPEALPLTYDRAVAEQQLIDLAAVLYVQPIDEVTKTYLSGRASEVTTQGVVGRQVTNTTAIVESLQAYLQQPEPIVTNFVFEELPFARQTVEVDDRVRSRTVTYSVEVWGAVEANADEFAAQAAETYADSRGWIRANVRLQRVASGGSFTLVLAEPARVAAASPACSATYSCRVGRYVIINDLRWRTATSSWNTAGGSLRDYRHMVINHETGHWLGEGHRSCPAVGQPAPVMMQQSISLGGCIFNPWPLASEIQSVAS